MTVVISEKAPCRCGCWCWGAPVNLRGWFETLSGATCDPPNDDEFTLSADPDEDPDCPKVWRQNESSINLNPSNSCEWDCELSCGCENQCTLDLLYSGNPHIWDPGDPNDTTIEASYVRCDPFRLEFIVQMDDYFCCNDEEGEFGHPKLVKVVIVEDTNP